MISSRSEALNVIEEMEANDFDEVKVFYMQPEVGIEVLGQSNNRWLLASETGFCAPGSLVGFVVDELALE